MTESDILAYSPMILDFLAYMDDDDVAVANSLAQEVSGTVITDFLPPGSSVVECYIGSMCIDGLVERCQSVIFSVPGGDMWTAMSCKGFGVSSMVKGPQYASNWS